MRGLIFMAGVLCVAVNAAPQAVEVPGAVEYGPMRVAGAITDPQINESSGLAAARAPGNEGLFWTHNDSGDTPRLFLLSERGTLRATYQIDVPFATDWEDLCSFQIDGEPYLLIGDVGDNGHRRQRVTLWLVPEPIFDPEQTSTFADKLTPTRRIDFTYADGPQDCESIGFDPTSDTIVVVTKILPQRTTTIDTAGVYLVPLPTEEAAAPPHVLERVADLPLRVTVAMDVAPDGRRAVVATYGDAWQYVRRADESWADAFARPGTVVELGPRGQSEAIAFDADGETLVLTAEGVGKPLWRVSSE